MYTEGLMVQVTPKPLVFAAMPHSRVEADLAEGAGGGLNNSADVNNVRSSPSQVADRPKLKCQTSFID